MNRRIYWVVICLLVALLMILHAWNLADMPRGLYLDETSIGVNALGIAEQGRDEHNVAWPIYFEAFGEYKNPIYIYLTAALFKLFGPSDYVLRLPGTLFMALALLGGAVLARLVWPQQPIIGVFIVLTLGLLPWYWPMSRIAFETISQLPAWIWLLIFTYWAYEQPAGKYTWLLAMVMGLVGGVSVYTYSTSRLLTFLYMTTWAVLYVRRKTINYSVLTCLYFGVALVPYMFFSITHPGALTDRFKLITYIYDPTLSLGQKVGEFIQNYARQFSPDFLLLHGDHNIRHAIGFGGELYLSVAALSLLGVLYLFRQKRWRSKWTWLLLSTLVVAPVAAALTTGDTGHSLRTITEGIIFVILAGYGVVAVTTWAPALKYSTAVLTIIFIVLICEATVYQYHYWVDYPPTSGLAFESYNLKGVLASVVAAQPSRIILMSEVPPIHISWYRATMSRLAPIPTVESPPIHDLSAQTCVVYDSSVRPPLNTPNTTKIKILMSRFAAECI